MKVDQWQIAFPNRLQLNSSKKCRYASPWRGSANLYSGSGDIAPQGLQPMVRGAKPPEADDISTSLDYIREVNVTPEFMIMGVL